MTGPACGTENRVGRMFCSNCGSALARSCPACGAANEPDDRFCGDCGAPLDASGTANAATAPVAERRLVSVLFGDLVGFTPLSEDRDPEEVRELLSRYFDTARQVIERYGGTVEKFIGDAVMAEWVAETDRGEESEALLGEAREIFERLEATPWLERLEAWPQPRRLLGSCLRCFSARRCAMTTIALSGRRA